MEWKKIDLFSALEEERLDYLQSFSKKLSYQEGNILFFEGEKPNHLYVLLKGILKIYKTDPRGNEVVIHYIQPPSLVAELVNLEGMNYPASAIFESDGEILAIDYAIFERDFLKNGDMAFYIIKSLTRKIKALEEVITSNLTMDTTSRVAKFFYDKSEELPCLSQRKIASILNTTPETLSRIVKKLKEEKIITVEKGSIIEVNKGRLKEEFDLF
ncbi:Crp/Fnr family transcriptional regulator [Wolinella succinogenes]|nr:Crp/Fnr family transcriptional regulator [Wolinella succinogenes]VEG80256.1 cAMP regulatory protein [Wolinella succinogenes]HCZ17956.1 Crp/Fnr family transcriptional regulator [Helicobacter sp.]